MVSFCTDEKSEILTGYRGVIVTNDTLGEESDINENHINLSLKLSEYSKD